jgi:hypothetical protein
MGNSVKYFESSEKISSVHIFAPYDKYSHKYCNVWQLLKSSHTFWLQYMDLHDDDDHDDGGFVMLFSLWICKQWFDCIGSYRKDWSCTVSENDSYCL